MGYHQGRCQLQRLLHLLLASFLNGTHPYCSSFCRRTPFLTRHFPHFSPHFLRHRGGQDLLCNVCLLTCLYLRRCTDHAGPPTTVKLPDFALQMLCKHKPDSVQGKRLQIFYGEHPQSLLLDKFKLCCHVSVKVCALVHLTLCLHL